MKKILKKLNICMLTGLLLLCSRSANADTPVPPDLLPPYPIFTWEMPSLKPRSNGYELASAINVGIITGSLDFHDCREYGEYGSPYPPKGKDICYQFVTVQPETTVFIDLYGSENVYGYLHLMKANPEAGGVVDIPVDWSTTEMLINDFSSFLPDYYSGTDYYIRGAFTLEPGHYYFVNEGPYGNAGAYSGRTVTNLYAFTQGAPFGEDFLLPIEIGLNCSQTFFTDVQSAERFKSTYGAPETPNVIYQVELNQASRIEMSKPVEAEAESAYFLLDGMMNTVAYSNAAKGLVCEHLDPGFYFIINKALTPAGRIGMNAYITRMDDAPGSENNPIDLGDYKRSFTIDRNYQSKYYCTELCPGDSGPSAVHYKINLLKNMALTCTMDGRGYKSITIKDKTGALVYSSNSRTPLKEPLVCTRNLDHGEYLLIFETDGDNHSVWLTMAGHFEMTGPARDLLTLSSEESYVLTVSPTIATRDIDLLERTQARYEVCYTDGLGREKQTIKIWGANGENDLVRTTNYDCAGREDSVSYLPFVSRDNSGMFRSDYASEQSAYYGSKFGDDPDVAHTVSKKQYDASGLLILETAAGENAAHHPIRHQYRLNTVDELKHFEFVYPNGVVYSETYDPGTLQVHVSWQENLPDDQTVQTYDYMDARGLKVAIRAKSASEDVYTYNVYDDIGRLRYKIPSIAADSLAANTIYGPETLLRYAYYFDYDGEGRQTKAFIPGAEPIYQLYDNRGRVVLKQTGNQRAEGRCEWTFTKYDDANRPVLIGIFSGGTYEEHAAALRLQTVFGEERGTEMHGYTNRCYPVIASENDVLKINYYDDYDWLPADSTLVFSPSEDLGITYSSVVWGKSTGTKSKVLGIDENRWLASAIYYDYKYRTIQSVSELYPGGIEIVSNKHDFVGNVVQTRVVQTIGSQQNAYDKWFDYDHLGRLLSVRQAVANDSRNAIVTLAAYTYDESGLVSGKSIHNGTETTDYTYRVTGEKIAETSTSFSYALGFDRPAAAGLSMRADGGMASMAWGYGSDLTHGYSFAYDSKGQMTDACHVELESGIWNEKASCREGGISYDDNGNITAVQRTDIDGNMLHDLIFRYDGNRLQSVTNSGRESASYAYDADGNMTYDGLRGVSIEYNWLNLPARIFAGADEIRYIYDGNGTKLAAVTNGSFTYYRHTMVYGQDKSTSSEKLLYMLQPEGIATLNTSGEWTYKYFKTDHLGNTRALLATHADSEGGGLHVEQTTDYYPFGLAWEYKDLHLNRYLYNGKELQDASIGSGLLGLYDFGARYYDPMLGRWFNIDPALQLMNPYLYCGNSPMIFIDENGEFFLSFFFGFWRGIFTGENPFETGWNSVKNSAKLFGGMFAGNFKQIISRLTWELPQTLLGLTVNVGANWFCDADVDYAYGATVMRLNNQNFGAFTLGSYIMGDKNIVANPSNFLFQHEYGHYLQSQAWGPFYMGKVAIPSLISAKKNDSNEHDFYKTEQDANVRALKYWEKKFPGFYQDEKGWDHGRNPIAGFEKDQKFNSPANQKALGNGRMSGIGGVDFLQIILPGPIGWSVTGSITY